MTACFCENSHCLVCGGNEPCKNPASTKVGCQFIGSICDPCAEQMPDEFLFDLEPEPRVPDGGPRGFEYSESERRDIRDAGRGHLL